MSGLVRNDRLRRCLVVRVETSLCEAWYGPKGRFGLVCYGAVVRDMTWIAAVVCGAVVLGIPRMGSASYGLAGLGMERAFGPVRSASLWIGLERRAWV